MLCIVRVFHSNSVDPSFIQRGRLSLMHCEKEEKKKEKAREILFLITMIRNIHWLRSTRCTILKLLNKSCSLIESNCST